MRLGYEHDIDYYYLRDWLFFNSFFKMGDKAVDLPPITRRQYFQRGLIGLKSDLPSSFTTSEPEAKEEPVLDSDGDSSKEYIMPRRKTKKKGRK